MALLFAFIASLLPAGMAVQSRVTPVQKVVQMMTEMKAKGEKMVADETATFATYKEWVDDRTTELGFEIQTAEKKITELVAFIEKADSDVSQLRNAIEADDAEIAKLDAEKKESTDVRGTQRAEFEKLEADYSESVDALTRAIQHVSANALDQPQTEALLQRMGASRVLAALVQQGQASNAMGAPAVDAYEHQSGGVVEILEGLLKKFKGELDDLVSDETNQAHYYDLQQLHLTNTITQYTTEREEKVVSKAKRAEASAQAKGELAETRENLAEDKKFLSDMTATFRAKSEVFAANQEVRAQELEAIGKAIEIISTPEVSASYAEHVKLAQLGSAPALVQIGSTKLRLSARQRAAALLNRQGARLASTRLTALAARVTANPFVKVVEMIENLLAKLKEEAIAEADHKQWCDEQLKENKLKREKKTSQVELLSAEKAERQAQIETMTSNLATLAKEQEELSKSMSEATALRTAEAAENSKAISDAKAGGAAVKSALVVLREFYDAQGGEGAALLQDGKQVPEMKAYSGMGGENKGVVGMLEVIETDFARLDADTTAAETQAAREYDEFMSDAKADNKQKHDTEVKTKLEKDQAEFEQSGTVKEVGQVEEELAKANEYYDTLKPTCLEVHVSYEERVARRKEEIEALKEAYDVLGSKASA